MDDTTGASDRRRFLTRLGATLAAGIGLAGTGALGGAPAGARRPRRGTGTSCAIYCYADPCCPCPDGPGLQFRCYDQCWGWAYYCAERACGAFCMSQYAC